LLQARELELHHLGALACMLNTFTKDRFYSEAAFLHALQGAMYVTYLQIMK
jgi:hypothetical protein